MQIFIAILNLNIHFQMVKKGPQFNPLNPLSNLVSYPIQTEQWHQLKYDQFLKGLIFGLESEKSHFFELTPFILHLVFKPIFTIQAILEGVNAWMTALSNKEWKTLDDSLALEIKELYLSYGSKEDYQKGVLVGQFIGKNGATALVEIGINEHLIPSLKANRRVSLT